MNFNVGKDVICPFCKNKNAVVVTVSSYIGEPTKFEVKCISCGSVFELPEDEFEKICLQKEDTQEGKETTMQVTYNGFTGELVKLERHIIQKNFLSGREETIVYDLSIYDSEKKVTHSFTGVKLEDVKFLGGDVSFG